MKSPPLHWSRKQLEPRRLRWSRTAHRHGEAGGGVQPRSAPCPPPPGLPRPVQGPASSSLLSSFALATCCHFTRRSKGSRPSHIPEHGVRLGMEAQGQEGELELCPNKYWNQRLALLSPRAEMEPKGCHALPRFLGWCHLPAVRETSESVLTPPSLSLSFSTSSWSPKAARLVREPIAECDGRLQGHVLGPLSASGGRAGSRTMEAWQLGPPALQDTFWKRSEHCPAALEDQKLPKIL